MSRSSAFAHVTRLVAGATVSLGLALSPWIPSANLQAQQQSRKQALLNQPNRAADAPEVLRVGRPLARDAARLAYVPGHIVVKFAEGVSPQAMSTMAADIGGQAVRGVHHADFVYVHIPKDADPVAAASEMSRKPGVVYAEPDGRVFTMFRPNDPLYRYQWNLQKIDMERTWDVNRGAKNALIVAVIDSGVAFQDKGAFAQAPELKGVPFVSPYDFVWDDTEPFDFDGHGTHIAGTIAQATNNDEGTAGMSFNVSIMPIKAIFTEWDAAFDAPFPYGASTVARAIRYAADNGAKVINLSIGSFFANTASRDAMEYAIGKGAFLAIAAGNDGDAGNPPTYPAVYAKDMDGAMAVAAVDFNLARSYYSNVNDYVEIAAPGGDNNQDLNNDEYADGILQQTFDPDAASAGVFNQFIYAFEQGTSMATAHVSGLAALLMDQGITTPKAVEDAIKAFATDTGAPGRDNETGFGVINPRRTIRGLGLRR
jgi:serine protease